MPPFPLAARPRRRGRGRVAAIRRRDPLLRNSCSVSIGSMLVSIPDATSGVDDGFPGVERGDRHLDVDDRFRRESRHGRRAHVVDPLTRSVAERFPETGRPPPRTARASPGRSRRSPYSRVRPCVSPGFARVPRHRATSENPSKIACCAGSCRGVSSGCHWTPTIHISCIIGVVRRRARSPRPGRPRSSRSPRVPRPGGRSLGGDATNTRATPTSSVAEQPAAGRRLHRRAVEIVSAIGTPCSSMPGMSGRCWWSVPPNATFMTCMPRQIASVGSAEPVRGEQQVDLELVAVGFDAVGVLHRRVAAVARRVDVAAAHQAPARRTAPGSPRGRSSRRGSRSGRARRNGEARRCTGRGRRSRRPATA